MKTLVFRTLSGMCFMLMIAGVLCSIVPLMVTSALSAARDWLEARAI